MNGPKPLRARFNLVVTLVLIVIVDLSATSYITLTKNGYQNVVINIQESTGFSNCQQAIEDIKQLVRNTSTSFAQGLERPVSFGNVVIIVPSSWASDTSCLTVSNTSELAWARSNRADMQITSDHPVFGSFPYSFQYSGCKVSGLPINVPLSFITDNSITAKGKKMAREWAHYRYGVFDEGGIPDDPRHPSSYMIFQTESSDMVARANTCSDNKTPNGDWIGDECSKSTGNSSCEFVVDSYNPDIKSSLMYRPDLDNMEKFCTHSNHDDSVPSKLTYHCGSLSASEVIYKHRDFTSGFPTLNTSAEITFSVIQNPFSGYHVILDVASFPNSNLFDVAKSSLMQFINFLFGPVRLSIDIYDENGWTEFQLPIEMNNETKLAILDKMNNLKWNRTSNPNNFYQALENAEKRAYDGQDVIILTNIQSVIPELSNWVTSYQEAKVNVHLVHFGVSSNEFVEIAKLAVYGSVHFTPNFPSSNTASSYTWATNTLQSIYSQTKTYRAKIFEQPIIISSTQDSNKDGSFYVDSSASRLLLSIYYLRHEEGNPQVDEFKLFQPNGISVTIPKESIIKSEEFYALAVESTGEFFQPGLWHYEITFNVLAAKNKAMRLDVFAEVSNSSFIQLRTWNSAIDNQAVDFTSGPVGLYAQLTKDRKPIVGANVIARVYAGFNNGTSSLVAEIPLLDEGVADVASGDGIYSGWLSKFSDSSISYSVNYLAYGVNSMAKVDNGVYDRPPTTGSVIPMSSPVPVAEQFNRFGYGPSFQLSSKPSNGDQIPPQRVTDLAVKSYDSSSRMAVLGWTAVRDNFGTGDNVTYYELEQTVGSESPTKITKSFTNSEAITLNWEVEVPSVNEGEYVRYRIRGRDTSFNFGETSNVVSLAGPPLPVNVNLSTGAIVGIVIGSIILLIIIIIIIFCLCCPVEAKRKKRAATRKIQGVFKSKDKNKNNAAPIQRYEPPTTSWQSPVVNNEIPVNRRDSDVHIEPQTQVEIRQKKTGSTAESNRGSERIYFGQEDLNQMKKGSRSETYSERGTEEMVKRAPSMDLQLAAVLKLNSSNFSIDRLGLDEQDASGPKPIEVVNPKTYARPYKPNPNANRPASNGPYYNPNKPMSRSENNLYYTDVELKPTGQSTRSTPSNSYLSVYAEQRAEVVPQQSTQSSLANSLRAGMRNEEWQDSNSFVYTDPRFDNQSNRGSSFDPQLHPANQVGLPPSLPSMPPPLLPRNYVVDDRSSNASSMSGVNQQQMGRSPSKPSLISAV